MRREILEQSDILSMLQECNQAVSVYSLDLNEDSDWRTMMQEDKVRHQYIDVLAEGLDDSQKATFEKLCENISELANLSEANTTAGFLPQAKLVMPLFRFMWPKLVAKELVNVIPMDSPEIVRYFFRPEAKDGKGNVVKLPSYTAIGTGIEVGKMDDPWMIEPGSSNIIEQAGITGADKDQATVARGVILTAYEADDGSKGIIRQGHVDEEGKFSVEIQIDTENKAMVSGRVNFRTGDIVWSQFASTTGTGTVKNITKIGIVANVLTSEFNKATTISFDPMKIRFTSEDMELQAEWSIQWEQDQKARMNLDVQSEFISVFGNQIQLNIDSLILNDIYYSVEKFNTGNIQTFYKTPDRAAYAGTLKRWAEELLLRVETASANIYNATSLMPANYLAVNPKDLVWFRMLEGFDYKGGDYGKDGVLGCSPVVGTFQNSYTVLSSPIIPAGKILVAAKPTDISFSGYIYAPYVPISLIPYPLGKRPAMTVLSRYGRKMLRPEMYGIINLV